MTEVSIDFKKIRINSIANHQPYLSDTVITILDKPIPSFLPSYIFSLTSISPNFKLLIMLIQSLFYLFYFFRRKVYAALNTFCPSTINSFSGDDILPISLYIPSPFFSPFFLFLSISIFSVYTSLLFSNPQFPSSLPDSPFSVLFPSLLLFFFTSLFFLFFFSFRYTTENFLQATLVGKEPKEKFEVRLYLLLPLQQM